MGGLGGLDRLPGPPARSRGLKKRAPGTGRTYPDGLAAEPDDRALGRSHGGLTTKILLAVDASFHVLAAVITAGRRGDAPAFTEVMDRIRMPRISGGRPRTRPDHVLADRACSSRAVRRRGCAAGPGQVNAWSAPVQEITSSRTSEVGAGQHRVHRGPQVEQ
ncbi:transposase [Streptomyces sp. NPDC059802]|uniref:transposase n=1 Tax=Streptomyces sp. NPDC059802 TaxID=3346952 RepID=UPI0036575D0F